MIDIKSLFLTAKQSGSETDVSAYTEAINNVFESSPRDYVLQLEYIIQSSVGIKTLIPFIEKWGMPIALYDTIYECVSECIDKATEKKADATAYTEAKEYLEKFRKDHVHCFAMYEFYRPEDVSGYIRTYYGSTNGHQNRYLGSGIIQKFGEYAIPDTLISARPYAKSTAGQKFFEYIDKMDRTPLENEFLKECFADLEMTHVGVLNEAASTIVDSMHDAHHEEFREAMIMGDLDAEYEYTEQQFDALQDLISYKEYMITWADETGADIQKLTDEMHALAEEVESINNESDANLVEMLPSAKTEAPSWVNNTSDKKHSTVAPYLKRNHDIASWGEEEPAKKEDDNKPSKEDELDNYRHPDTEEDDNETDLDFDKGSNATSDTTEDEPKSIPSGVTNYYYYTYQNSLNKNDHSFNDQSSGKHINSHNGKIPEEGTFDKDKVSDEKLDDARKDIEEKKVVESRNVWELDLGLPEVFNEAAKPIGEAADDDRWSDDEDDRVGSADDGKPESDHPVKDIFMDIDRRLGKVHQGVKKGIQNVANAGRAAVKPAKRTKQWIDNMITAWKDTKETNIKEKLANPKERAGLFGALRASIKNGALFKAGLLLNPIILGFRILSHSHNKKNEQRLKNEMMLELQQEQEIIKAKIADAESKMNYAHSEEERRQAQKDKYQLMRFQTELRKKLWRVAGNKNVVNMI